MEASGNPVEEAPGTRVLTVREILFDLDGTLIDSISAVETAWAQWARQRKISYKSLPEFHGRPARETLAHIVEPHEVITAENQIRELEMDSVTTPTAKKGAISLLASLPEDRWSVVTSGHRQVSLHRIKSAGLPLPKVLVSGDDVTHGKPDPEPFRLGQTRSSDDGGVIVAVEDTIAGLQSARQANCFTIGVIGTMSEEALRPWADVVVSGLADITLVQTTPDGLLMAIDAYSHLTV